jgi:O-antigen ligase
MNNTQIGERNKHNSFLLCIAAFLIFIGSFKIWLGDSALTFPLGIIPIFISLFTIRQLKINNVRKDLYIIIILISVCLSATILNKNLTFARSIVSTIPFFVIPVVLVASASISYKMRMENWIDLGTIFLACLVLFSSISIQSELGVENAQIYEIKTKIETPLGFSNYLASFLLYSTIRNSYRKWWLSFMTFIAMLSLISRVSLFICTIFMFYRLSLYNKKIGIIGSILFGLIILFCIVYNIDIEMIFGIRAINDISSAESRGDLWVVGLEQFLKTPLVGVGPGGLKDLITNNASGVSQELWDPHNSIISLISSFGLLGLVSYCTYLFRAMKSMWVSAKYSDIWMGNFLGIFAMLIQSLFEPIVLTASFEFLLALLYGQSLQHLSSADVKIEWSTKKHLN